MVARNRVVLDTKKLDALIRETPEKLENLVSSTALAAEGEAKARVAVDTGALKNSLHVTEVSQFVRRLQDGMLYGIYQELGTSRMRAHPFIVPALKAVEKKFLMGFRNLF